MGPRRPAPGGDATLVDSAPAYGTLSPGRVHRFWRVVSRHADGSTVALPIAVIAGRSPRPRVVAIGGVHGDEHEGPAALTELLETVDPAALAGALVVVPVANPPAFRANLRCNPADAVDMNRVFPGDPEGSITHRLAHALVSDVVAGADFAFTIHGWTTGSLTIPYVEYTGDDPTSPASRAGAVAFGLEYLEQLPMLSGRLLSHATSLGIPAFEVEIGGEGVTVPERRALGVRGALGSLRALGALQGAPEPHPRVRDITRCQVLAPAGGMLRRHVAIGETVSAGAALATIADFHGGDPVKLAAPCGGVVAMLRHALSVEPGDLVAVVFSDLLGGQG